MNLVTINVNFNLYKSFLAVYQCRNISRAADELLLTPPAISRNLRELEGQLNIERLFTRVAKGLKRGVEPTNDADTLYPQVLTAFNILTKAEQDVQVFDRDSRATIRMAIPSTFAAYHFSEYFYSFCNEYPNVQFEFCKKESVELLSQGKIDFAIRSNYVFSGYDFHTINLFSEKIVLIAARSFLINKNLINYFDNKKLTELPIIAQKEVFEEFSSKIGLSIKPYMLMSETEPIYNMVKNGLGIGILFARIFDTNNTDEVVEISVKDMPTFETFVCAYNQGHLSKAAQTFINGLVNFCKTKLS